MALGVVEIKAFVPAKDFGLSKQFYQAIGFNLASEGGRVAYFHFDRAAFLLQDCWTEAMAEFNMHMLVPDVDAWWTRIHDIGVAGTYGVEVTALQIQPWRMKDFCLTDPSGVVWRIGQNVD